MSESDGANEQGVSGMELDVGGKRARSAEGSVQESEGEELRTVREKYQRMFVRIMMDLDDPCRTVFRRLGFSSLSTNGELAAQFGMGEGLLARQADLKVYLEEILEKRLRKQIESGRDAVEAMSEWGFSHDHAREWTGNAGEVHVDLLEGDMLAICSALKQFHKLKLDRKHSIDKRERHERRMRLKRERKNEGECEVDSVVSWSASDMDIAILFQESINRMICRQHKGKISASAFAWLIDPNSFEVQVIRETAEDVRVYVTCKCSSRLRLFITGRTANIGALRRHLFGAGKEAANCRIMKVGM